MPFPALQSCGEGRRPRKSDGRLGNCRSSGPAATKIQKEHWSRRQSTARHPQRPPAGSPAIGFNPLQPKALDTKLIPLRFAADRVEPASKGVRRQGLDTPRREMQRDVRRRHQTRKNATVERSASRGHVRVVAGR